MRSYETTSLSSSKGATLWGQKFCEHNVSFMLDHLYKRTLRNPSIVHYARVNRQSGWTALLMTNHELYNLKIKNL